MLKEKELNEYINLLEDLYDFTQQKIDFMYRAKKSEGSIKELYLKNIQELDAVITEKKPRLEELRSLRRK